MHPMLDKIREGAVLGGAIFVIMLFLWLWLKQSREPWMLILRWVLSGAVLWLTFWGAGKMFQKHNAQEFDGIVIAAVAGIVMAIVWVPLIVEAVSRKLGSLYDGGDAEVELKPLYSVSRALRAKGKYNEAVAAVWKQLQRFPEDFEGQLLLAEIQAENFNDLPAAEEILEKAIAQKGQSPGNVASALNRMADWRLEKMKDREGAREALERIGELLPGTEWALQAGQRIARLADPEGSRVGEERRPVVARAAQRVGLAGGNAARMPAETDPGLQAAELVRHLESHPQDSHTRERLAVIYANHYHRLDLATEQLEKLIEQPQQQAKQVVRWLNLLADLQVQNGVDADAVRATLQRIVDKFPGQPAALTTQRRLDTLSIELKAKESQGQTVKMGNYEQNIGLKGRGPRE